VIDARRVQDLELEGLKKERASVLPGGLAILIAVFEALRVEEMTVVESALREGVLYDLIGRRTQHDIREVSIKRFSERFAIDRAHAARVETTALDLFDQVAEEWKLGEFARQLLSWSARLHELGTFLSHASYHKHGAYMLHHADLSGFSRDEQQILAGLVLLHRGKLTESRREEVGPVLTTAILRTALLLRLAVRLHRSRDPEPLPALHLEVDDDELELAIGEKWLKDHPLTEADLEDEATAFKTAGFRLRAR
jgi:exopolyphosphatase / guanosine-5'-triphosphate,3'-diphosphate pyrophosphatase